MELFLVTLFRIAPSKAYFGYFRYVQVPSDPHRARIHSETFGTIFKTCRTAYNAVLRMAYAWTN